MTVVIDGTTGIDTIQDNTVSSAKIVNGSISAADLSGAQTGNPPVYGVRAWCVFDGTLTGTNAPTAGGNVTSVTRSSLGNYTVNFTTAMPDANYCPVFGQIALTGNNGDQMTRVAGAAATGPTLKTTTQLGIITGNVTAATANDAKEVYVAILR